MRRMWPVILAVVLVLTMNVGPAMALTTKRLWQASVGTNAVNGRMSLRAYTNSTGLVTLRLKAMKANASYSVEIRAGTCANLGTLRASFVRVTSTATGEINTIRNVSGTKMSAIWKVARSGPIAFRTVSGTHVRCANLTFPVATRIVVSSLGINLPVMKGPSGYPPCKVAMYQRELMQPREPGVSLDLCPRTDGDVPAPAHEVEDQQRGQPDRHEGQGVHERFQGLDLSDRVGPPPRDIAPVGLHGHVGAPVAVHVRGAELAVSQAHRERQAALDGRHDLHRLPSEGAPRRLLSSPSSVSVPCNAVFAGASP